MRLIEDWRTVLGKSWANRINVLSLAAIVLPLIGALPDETRDILPRWFFSVLPIALIVLAILARIIEQPKLQNKLAHKRTVRSLEERRARRAAAAARIAAEEAANRGKNNG